jgi:hypothetical protein
MGKIQQKSKKSCAWLLDYKLNVYSETGEDGIIKKILEILPSHDKWCVEFGAWDGQHASNTRNLILNEDYSAVLIETDKAKFAKLQKNYAQNNKVITLNQIVGFERKNNLDSLLKLTPIPLDFDFLSIDIDGNDFHVWKAISKYNPKVICIEFNPTIPTEVEFVQPADHSINQGSSLLSIVKLGNEKGYELVSVLPYNAFFVKSEYYPLFEISDNSPASLRKDLKSITYLFSGYDGTIFLRGNLKLPWHPIELKESKVQHIPKFLRKYPYHRKIDLILLLLLANPCYLFNALWKRIINLRKR